MPILPEGLHCRQASCILCLDLVIERTGVTHRVHLKTIGIGSATFALVVGPREPLRRHPADLLATRYMHLVAAAHVTTGTQFLHVHETDLHDGCRRLSLIFATPFPANMTSLLRINKDNRRKNAAHRADYLSAVIHSTAKRRHMAP